MVALCITQISSWGILYYAFPVMLTAVTADTGWTTGTALAAYSVGLLASAVAAPAIGRLIDRRGPRPVMTIGSILGSLAVVAVAAAHHLPWFFAAWFAVGIAQSAVLYPPAFAAITGWFGAERVRALTAVTLVGGLASTVFAPLTAGLLHLMDWRSTLLVLAGILAAITIPLHAFALSCRWTPVDHRPDATDADRPAVSTIIRSRPFVLMTAAMALAGFGMFGATLNLIPLQESRGIGNTAAAVVFGLVGIGQVAGRFGYPALSRHTGPATRMALVMVIGAAAVALLGVLPGSVAPFVVVGIAAGTARGIFTLLQATAVSDRWGTANYGSLNGVASAPIAAALVAAPAAAAALVELVGSYRTVFLLLALLTVVAAVLARGSTPHR